LVRSTRPFSIVETSMLNRSEPSGRSSGTICATSPLFWSLATGAADDIVTATADTPGVGRCPP
jgi:hypothetical protein